ncbi:hypothetical protein QJS10_CPB14g01225 [Acorus calamus]|uniref:Light-harvesting complex-like protein OHP2, chloroplastic n=1 Tax=Acorus calamus TaxID=4465 RepID=A0AAV9DD89_ACOCL|nr:hypothetical protein QJS10_CPB14g01225 [Acorus calamus]
MSIASSIPYIKLPHTSSSPTTSYTTPPALKKFSSKLPIIRSSNSEGPLRRPSLSPPPTTTLKPAPPPSQSPPPPPSPLPVSPSASAAGSGVVTLEYQRKVAKELQEYFRQKKLEEANQGPLFGFVGKNEISNGRWAMFGFAVGMLTEYATGADFVQQVKILFSNFGILDLD